MRTAAPLLVLIRLKDDECDDVMKREYAQQGPAALRRFIERTQGIYELDFYYYIRPEWTTSAKADARDHAGTLGEREPAKRLEVTASLLSSI